MDRSIEDIEKELKAFYEELKARNTTQEKKDGQITLRPLKEVKKDGILFEFPKVKAKVKAFDEKVKAKVKVGVKFDAILGDIKDGLKPIEIAKRYGISKSAVSQRIKALKKKGLLSKEGGFEKKVKDLILCRGKDDPYEFQTIQILVPLKRPRQFDLIDWEKINQQTGQRYKGFPYFKFTLSRTSKSVILILHRRYIEYPEQVKEVCHAYVKWARDRFLEYDIDLDISKATCYGLHLWEEDPVVKDNYKKEMGKITLKHGIDSAKVFDSDAPKERVTWIDSTPTPDGIESNDYSYFNDKLTMEYFIGKPESLVDDKKLMDYMAKADRFIGTMDKLDGSVNEFINVIDKHTDVTQKQIDVVHLDVYNKQLHQRVLESMDLKMGDLGNGIQEFTSEIKDLRQAFLMTKNKTNESNDPFMVDFDYNNIKVNDQLPCPKCNHYFYPKQIVARGFICPSCFFDLRLVYPYLVQHKADFERESNILDGLDKGNEPKRYF